MLRCLSKFGQLTTRPSFRKSVQIRKPSFIQPCQPILFARKYSDLPFSRSYGRKPEEIEHYNQKQPKDSEDFSFINSGLFAGEGFFAPTEDLVKKEHKTYWDALESFSASLSPFELGHKWTIDGFLLRDGAYIKDFFAKYPLDEEFEIEEPEEQEKFLEQIYNQHIPTYHITDVVFPSRKIVYPMNKDSDDADGCVFLRYVVIDTMKKTVHFVEYDTEGNKETNDSLVEISPEWWMHFKKVKWPKGISINEAQMVTDIVDARFRKPDQLFDSFKRDYGQTKYRRVNLLVDAQNQEGVEEEGPVEEGIEEEALGLEEEQFDDEIDDGPVEEKRFLGKRF